MARDVQVLSKSAAIPPRKSARRHADTIARAISFVVLLLFVVLWLIPFAWAVDTSLKPEGETTIVPITWLSSHFNLDNFGQVLDQGHLPRWYLNSLIISSVVTVATVVLASLASFAFSQIRFRGRGVMFWVVMAGIMIPGQMLIVPLYTMMNDWNFIDTYWGVILPQLANPIAVFVFKQFFAGIPHELSDAAVLESRDSGDIVTLGIDNRAAFHDISVIDVIQEGVGVVGACPQRAAVEIDCGGGQGLRSGITIGATVFMDAIGC